MNVDQSTKQEKKAENLKEIETKHLGSLEPKKHKRRRSQPLQMENPNKFQQMYQKHLTHYQKILREDFPNQHLEDQNLQKEVIQKINNQKNQNEIQSGLHKIYQQNQSCQLRSHKISLINQQRELLNLLKGLEMNEDILKEVMIQCSNLSKEC